jgi:serine/threonine-protein phosphatase PP1 catalytic subunit
MNSKDK